MTVADAYDGDHSGRAMLGILQPKVKDFANGEVTTDKDTGTPLVIAGVMVPLDGRAEMLPVTVLETSVAKTFKPGTPVAFTALTASPWENTVNGKQRHGIAFRAAALTAKAA